MATLNDRIYALINVAAAAIKLNATKIGDLATLATTAKTSLVVAINELLGRVNALPAPSSIINDSAPSSSKTQVWSAHGTQVAIDTKVAAVANASAQMLATLQTLGAEIASDTNAASAVLAVVSNKVDFSEAQSLSPTQQAQARTNIAALSAGDLTAIVGEDVDYVAYWNSAYAAA
jgi:hypothetical protein